MSDTGDDRSKEERLASLAMAATLATPGVHSMAASLADQLPFGFGGRELGSRGIRLSHDHDQTTLDIYVNVDYLAKIPVVAWGIQEKVKKIVEEETGRELSSINIHIQGVGFEDPSGGKE